MQELLGLHGLASKLRLPATWLKREADAQRIPHLKAGKRYLFNPVAVTAALAEQAAKPKATEVPSA